MSERQLTALPACLATTPHLRSCPPPSPTGRSLALPFRDSASQLRSLPMVLVSRGDWRGIESSRRSTAAGGSLRDRRHRSTERKRVGRLETSEITSVPATDHWADPISSIALPVEDGKQIADIRVIRHLYPLKHINGYLHSYSFLMWMLKRMYPYPICKTGSGYPNFTQIRM